MSTYFNNKYESSLRIEIGSSMKTSSLLQTNVLKIAILATCCTGEAIPSPLEHKDVPVHEIAVK